MATIFSRIAMGEIPCYKVAENDEFFAFLDINPIQKGHTLVIPKEEVDYLFDIDDEKLGRMMVFAKRVAAQIKSKMNSQLGYYTISSLIGSFGLNERLLYINELFDGSSESFSDAIKQLDAKTNLSDATIFTTELVNKFNWDIESETVEEFFQKLCRRYA